MWAHLTFLIQIKLLLLFRLLLVFHLIGLEINSFEHRFGHFVLPPLGDDQRKVLVQVLVGICQFDAFGVFLVERTNIEGVRRVHFPSGWYERGCVLLEVYLLPINASKEGVFFYFIRAIRRDIREDKKDIKCMRNSPISSTP